MKQLVELHGGTIAVRSQGINRGATFIITLPLPILAGEETVTVQIPNPSDDETEPLKGVMVLLVEDNKETRNALTAVLTDVGMQVIAAENVDAALEAARESNPDLIVSDIGLPGKDGYEFIQNIRQLEIEQQLAITPALALTAFAGDSNHRKAIEAGFQMHLSKPIESEQILFALRKLMSWKNGGVVIPS